MDLIGMLNDIKAHFDHGGQLAESHLPALASVAEKITADPFVQAAISTTLGPTGKAIVTDLVGRLEALEQERAAAAPPAEPEPAPAEPAA